MAIAYRNPLLGPHGRGKKGGACARVGGVRRDGDEDKREKVTNFMCPRSTRVTVCGWGTGARGDRER
jgi:hypothetical protein